ncbi:zinc finger domain-containing protein [Nanoarchaeota archaeon]
MVKKEIVCSSCKQSTANAGGATFKCPGCNKYEIVRCIHCRKIAAKYKCPECGFEGPN